MKTCKICGIKHPENQLHVVSKLSDKGFPVHSKNYKSAHEQANKKEKEKFPKGYEKLKKLDENLSKHELAGKNTKTGKIEVSKKVPKSLRKEVAFHEKTENKILRKKHG